MYIELSPSSLTHTHTQSHIITIIKQTHIINLFNLSMKWAITFIRILLINYFFYLKAPLIFIPFPFPFPFPFNSVFLFIVLLTHTHTHTHTLSQFVL